MDRSVVLGHLTDAEERVLGARLCDLAESALDAGEPRMTDFLDPAGRQVAAGVLARIDGIHSLNEGGYRRAERQRIALFPEYIPPERVDAAVCAIAAEGRFAGDPVTHRDVLGAVIGTGIRREKVGDLLINESACQIVMAREVLDFLLANLRQIGSVSVRVSEIDLEQLDVPPERVKEISTTVASMRLDAVASAGFSTSRSRIVRDVKADRVKVNWKSERDPSHQVKPGDVISMRGRGRVVIVGITGLSKKGRVGVQLKRLL